MPASIKKQIEVGIISPQTAANCICVSSNTIRNLVKCGKLNPVNLQTGMKGAVTISSLELLILVVQDAHPFTRDLAVAAVNYATKFEPNYLSYAKQILDGHGTLTREELKAIKLELESDKPIVWDKEGNLL